MKKSTPQRLADLRLLRKAVRSGGRAPTYEIVMALIRRILAAEGWKE